jgi:hypothetical protein
MLGHFKLRFEIKNLILEISFLWLRWLVWLKDLLRVRDRIHLSTIQICLFKIWNSGIKPLKAHFLETKLSILINFALFAFVQYRKNESRPIDLPNNVFINLSKIAKWVNGLLSCCQFVIMLEYLKNLTAWNQILDNLCVNFFELFA